MPNYWSWTSPRISLDLGNHLSSRYWTCLIFGFPDSVSSVHCKMVWFDTVICTGSWWGVLQFGDTTINLFPHPHPLCYSAPASSFKCSAQFGANDSIFHPARTFKEEVRKQESSQSPPPPPAASAGASLIMTQSCHVTCFPLPFFLQKRGFNVGA